MKEQIVCFVAGHSGGHIIPSAIQAKNEIDKHAKTIKILFFCCDSDLDKNILSNYDFVDYKTYLAVFKIKKNPIQFIKCLIFLISSFAKSLFVLFKKRPTKIVSMGGLISIPVCLAGKLLRIPLELWELNAEPGKTITFLEKFATKINICFPESQKYFTKKCEIVSYPLRFNEISKKLHHKDIIKSLCFLEHRKTILILGGSQGSLFINNTIKDYILSNELIHNKIQIIHQIGTDTFLWKDFYKKYNIPAIIFSFHDKMEEFYLASDLVICRSGAGTLAEVVFFEKKCITIPLQTASTNHQISNARNLQSRYPNLIYLLEQDENQSLLFNEINRLTAIN